MVEMTEQNRALFYGMCKGMQSYPPGDYRRLMGDMGLQLLEDVETLECVSEDLTSIAHHIQQDTDRFDRVELIAAACHQAWYAYAVLALGEDGEPWQSAPAWQKESIRDGVRFWDACSDVCSIEELCEASHRNWCTYKREDGWVYGPAKDPDKKTHPCLCPYDRLPPSQRKKDRVVVEAYLAMREVLGGEPMLSSWPRDCSFQRGGGQVGFQTRAGDTE